MPKAGFSSQDFYEPKLGFTEGWFELTSAVTKVHQFPPNKKTGDQSFPFLAAVLVFQKTDEKGAHTDDEPLENIIKIDGGWDNERSALTNMRPGNADSRDDADPTDLGSELDTEGNCIYAEEGKKIMSRSAWAIFVKSLEQNGFKASILGAGYFPDLVGLKGHAVTTKGEKFKSRTGEDVEPTALIVDKITVFPYEAKKTPAKAGKPAGKAAPAAASKGKPAPAVKEPESTDDNPADSAATELLIELGLELNGETRDTKKLWAMVYGRLVKNKDRDKTLDAGIKELINSPDWMTAKAEELGHSFDAENNAITFA